MAFQALCVLDYHEGALDLHQRALRASQLLLHQCFASHSSRARKVHGHGHGGPSLPNPAFSQK
eukprot:6460410-Amphidinium_carterae.1